VSSTSSSPILTDVRGGNDGRAGTHLGHVVDFDASRKRSTRRPTIQHYASVLDANVEGEYGKNDCDCVVISATETVRYRLRL
jgi:hypothetical protein